MFYKLNAAWLISFIILISCPLNAQPPFSDTTVVATIIGEKIETGEWKLFIREYRAMTIHQFRTICNCNYSKDFWSMRIQGTTPMEHLKKQAFDSLRQGEGTTNFRQDRGIVNDISYSGFIKKLNTENKRRKQAVSDHRVIYGPVQYTETVYYSYLNGILITELKQDSVVKALFDKKYPDLHDSYERKKEEFCSLGNRSVFYLVEQDGRCDHHPYILNDTIHLPEDDLSAEDQLRHAISDLQPGDTSRAFEYQGKNFRAILKEKSALGYRSETECMNLVRQHLFDAWYPTFVDSLVSNALIKIDAGIWDTVTF